MDYRIFLSGLFSLAVISSVCVNRANAIPITLGFDAPSKSCSNPPDTFSEGGMTVSSSRHVHVCENQQGQSQNLRNHRGSLHDYLFSYDSGAPFDLLQFDLQIRFRSSDALPWNPGRATFTSSNGGARTLDTLGTFTFEGPTWRNITWMRWEQGTNPFFSTRRTNTIMDQLVFAPALIPTPEPGSIILLGSGLFFGGLFHYRRDNKSEPSKKFK